MTDMQLHSRLMNRMSAVHQKNKKNSMKVTYDIVPLTLCSSGSANK